MNQYIHGSWNFFYLFFVLFFFFSLLSFLKSHLIVISSYQIISSNSLTNKEKGKKYGLSIWMNCRLEVDDSVIVLETKIMNFLNTKLPDLVSAIFFRDSHLVKKVIVLLPSFLPFAFVGFFFCQVFLAITYILFHLGNFTSWWLGLLFQLLFYY